MTEQWTRCGRSSCGPI